MFDLKETFKQIMMSSILGFVTKIISILISGWLDKYINHSLSNFIGLSINASLDFFMMKKVFHVEEQESKKFVSRYIVSIIVSVIAAQILYIATHAVIYKYYTKWAEKKWEKNVFFIRYAIGAVAYGFVEFPLQKFWVFKK
jgi:small basic protein